MYILLYFIHLYRVFYIRFQTTLPWWSRRGKGWYTYDTHENCPRPPTPLVHLRPTFFNPLSLGRPILNEHNLLPLQMITSQFKENIIQGSLLHVIRSFLQVGFRFKDKLINFAWLSFDVFSLSWSLTICFFVGYSCVSSCSKIRRNAFYL